MTEIKLTDANLRNLQVILEYLSDSEKKSYEEYIFNDFEELIKEKSDLIFYKEFYNKPEIEHIYAYTQRVKDAIETNLTLTPTID
jgi:hypothetical protein